jgi:type I restriction enzyme S subunit
VVCSAANRVAATCEEIEAYGLIEDDIVFNRVNSLSHLGKTAIVGRIAEPIIFESNMMRVRVDLSKIEPGFLFQLLNSPVCKKQVIGSAKRAVAQSSINQGSLKAFEIPVPPLDEQREIVRTFDAIASKSDIYVVKRDLLSDLFHTLLHQLMTAQIRVHELDLSEIDAVVGEA